MNAVVQGDRPWGARRRPWPRLVAAAVVVVVPAALPVAPAAAAVASINDIVMSADRVPRVCAGQCAEQLTVSRPVHLLGQITTCVTDVPARLVCVPPAGSLIPWRDPRLPPG